MASSKKKARQENAARMAGRAGRNASRIVGVYVLLLFIVHPLVIGTDAANRYGNITAAKLNTFYALLYGALAVLLIYLVLELANGWRLPKLDRDFFKKIRWYEYALVAYLVVLLISTLLSADTGTSFVGSSPRSEGFWTMLAYVAAIIMVGRLYQPRQRDLLIYCGMAALVCLYGFCQYYGNDFFHLFYEGYDKSQGPNMFVFSTMSNANVFSTYAGIAFILCLVFFSRMENPIQWAYLPIGLVLFYQLVIGDTRSGYLGLLAAVGLGFAFIVTGRKVLARLLLMGGCCLALLWLSIAVHKAEWPENKYLALKPYLLPVAAVAVVLAVLLYFVPARLPVIKPKTWRRVWAVVCLVVVVAAVVAIPLLADATGNASLVEVADVLRGNMSDRFATNRGFIWRHTLELMGNNPGRLAFGFGPDMFKPIFQENYFDAAMEANGEVPDKVHNEYLQLLFDEGIIALVLLVAALVLIIWGARKKLDEPAVLGVAVAMVFFLLQAVFNISTPFAHPHVFTFFGILAAMSYRDTRPLPQLARRAAG